MCPELTKKRLTVNTVASHVSPFSSCLRVFVVNLHPGSAKMRADVNNLRMFPFFRPVKSWS